MNEREAFEVWFKEKSPVGGVNAKLAARNAWLARAAVEADRAQRVLEDAISGALFDFAGFLTTLDVPVRFGSTEEASPMVELLQGFAKKRGLSLDNADVLHWSTKLASTPAQPAQQEPSDATIAQIEREIEAMLTQVESGSFPEFPARTLELAREVAKLIVAQHQDPPQQERKPMTDAEIEDLCGEANRGFCIELEDYKKAVQDTERHHGIRE